MDAEAQVVAYQRLFSADSSPARLRELALNGGLRASGLRSVCWKVFFGVIPHGATLVEWAKALDASRKAYDAHKDKILVDPHKNAEDKDLLTNNPLAQAEDSSWKRYFELQELQKDIQIDLERLNFDDPLFAEDGPHFQRVQGIMLRILTVWSSLNPSISYRQGMHELLAPLLAVVERDCQQGTKSPAESDAGLIGCVTDSAFTEHDGYALFDKLMEVVSESFAPQERKKEKDGQYARPGGVVARCDRMQNTLLRSKDYELYIHLQSQHIEPQLYSMKWIRLLLGREFHLEDVLLLWDAMFADHHETCIKGTKTLAGGRGLELLEYVCIAMLVYIRADLLGKDNMGCLQRLMKYPPVEDVKVFIKSALTFRDSTTTPTPELRQQQQQPPLPAAAPPHAAAPLPADPHPAAAAAAAAAPPNPTTAPPAMHRAGNSGGGGGGSSSTSWLLGGSSSSGLGVAGGGAAAAPANPPPPRTAGGHVAFVGGQVVHLGADAAAQAPSGLAAARASNAWGGAHESGGVGGGVRDMMNGALAVKMSGPLSVLERMLPPVGDSRRADMHKALDTLRQVQQALGPAAAATAAAAAAAAAPAAPAAAPPQAPHQNTQQDGGGGGASSFPFMHVHISNSETHLHTPQQQREAHTAAGSEAVGGGEARSGGAGGGMRGEGAAQVVRSEGGDGGLHIEIPDANPSIALAREQRVRTAVTPEPTEEERAAKLLALEQEKKKTEEARARRAAALSALLEPPSPGTFTALPLDGTAAAGNGDGGVGDGLGGLRSNKKVTKSAAAGLFGDDAGDTASWLK